MGLSNGLGTVWPSSDVSLRAVFSLASKANILARLKIGAAAVDLVILANDLEGGSIVVCSDRITDITRMDFI